LPIYIQSALCLLPHFRCTRSSGMKSIGNCKRRRVRKWGSSWIVGSSEGIAGLNRLKDTPQGLKPISFLSFIGPTEVVPCYKTKAGAEAHIDLHASVPGINPGLPPG
jgi:hypothetical protein